MLKSSAVKIVLKISGIILALALISLNFVPQIQGLNRLPNEIYVRYGDTSIINLGVPFSARIDGENSEVLKLNGTSLKDIDTYDLNKPIVISPVKSGDTNLVFNLFGFLPVKSINVKVRDQKKLVPGGQCIGVTLHTQGALVVGMSEISDESGMARNPAREAGILPGDVIMKLGATEIENADHMMKLLNDLGSSKTTIELIRDGEKMTVEATPVKDAQDGKYRLGIWVRDSTAGVGTLTFYDPDNRLFGSLGHAITDVDTKEKLTVKDGEIVESDIIEIKQGERGEPGEIHGSFLSNKPIGRIDKNTNFGIFGSMYQPVRNNIYREPVEIASPDEVKEGPATILTTLDDTGVQEYGCEIIRINQQVDPEPKGMIIKITDPNLLKKTGGIVQGMSGSPIMQNGKIIGAVTHVFVNDPTRGYGVFIEWMLEECEQP